METSPEVSPEVDNSMELSEQISEPTSFPDLHSEVYKFKMAERFCLFLFHGTNNGYQRPSRRVDLRGTQGQPTGVARDLLQKRAPETRELQACCFSTNYPQGRAPWDLLIACCHMVQVSVSINYIEI